MTAWCALGYALVFLLGMMLGALIYHLFVVARAQVIVRPERHTARMRRRDTLLLLAVLGCMIATAISTLGNVTNGRADRERTACTVRYNVAFGEARDVRDAASKAVTEAEVTSLQVLTAQGLYSWAYRDSMATRIVALEHLQDVRAANPFPDPDLCAGD